MTCDDIRELLPLYVGGEVEDNERIAVEAHVSMCLDCALDLEEFRAARGALAELKDGAAPVGAVEGVWRGVERKLFPPRAGIDWFVRCAAVLMIGLGAGYLGFTLTRAEPVPTRMAGLTATRDVVSGGRGSRSTFVDSREDRTPERRSWLPRVQRPDGSYYLPRAEAVTAAGDRDF